jgi:hypothetical protein
MLEAAWPIAVVVIGMCWFWFRMGSFEVVLLAPDSHVCMSVVTIAVGAGALIGYLQFAAERWRGTLGFALHRAGAHAALFGAKASVGIAATLLLAVGPMLVFASWQYFFSVNAPVLQGERIVEYALCGVSGASGYAWGVLASQLRRGWWLDLSALILGAVGVGGVTAWTVFPHSGSIASAVIVYLLVQGVMTAGAAWTALALMRNAHDRELPMPGVQHGVLAVLGIAVVLPPATCFLGVGLDGLRKTILDGYPVIAREVASGEWVLIDRTSLDLTGTIRRTSEPKRKPSDEPVIDPPKAELVYTPRTSILGPHEAEQFMFHVQRWSSRNIAFGPSWESLWWSGRYSTDTVEGRSYSPLAFLDEDDGTVRMFWIERFVDNGHSQLRVDAQPPKLPLERIFRRTGRDGRFSAKTISLPFGSKACVLIDFEDNTLWKLAPSDFENTFSELRLPDGDHLVSIEAVYNRDRLRVGEFQAFGAVNLFVGERGCYMETGSELTGFVPYVGKINLSGRRGALPLDAVRMNAAEQLIEVRPREIESDPISPRVEVRDGSGDKVLFAHVYGPRTIGEKLECAVLYAGVLLRTPIGCVLSFARGAVEWKGRPLFDDFIRMESEPLLFDGKRPWLLCVNFALAAMCVTSLVRRMKRQGASSITIALAASITALAGVIAYLYLRGLMAKQRETTTPVSSRARVHELLIQSA